MNERQFESAQEYFRRAAELDESSTVYQLNRARAIRAGGDAVRALEVADDSIGSDLNNIRAVVAVAAMRAESGDREGALSLARQLQQAHPNDPTPFALEAELLASAGSLDAASLAYDRALDVQVVRSQALRAFVVRRSIDHADAGKPLQLLIEQRPLDVDARMMLANYYVTENQYSESIAEYESLVAQQPDNGIVLNNLAWAYLQNNDPRAVATARKALKLLPDNASVIDTLGWTLVKTGAHKEAEPLLRRAVELSDKQPEIEYHHAVALSLSGQRDEARAALQSLLSRDDEFVSRKEAELLLSRLR
jgi:Tfp pilus assembly protein PilF